MGVLINALAMLLSASGPTSGAYFSKPQSNTPITLNAGDAAPPITFSSWIKGDPIPQFQKGTIYILDFWATWCRPCKLAMPHMSDVARRYKGKVQVIGVDVRETIDPGKALDDKVRAFAGKKSNHMNYSVCIDDAKKSMADDLDDCLWRAPHPMRLYR
jgi:thiol-disulfide isomerase/thioredoxin